MDPSDIASAFAHRDDDRAEMALRNQRRALKSREFKLTSLVSGIYAYSALGSGLVGIGCLTLGGGAIVLGIVLVALTLCFAFAIWLLWRSRRTSAWIIAAPCILALAITLSFGGWRTLGFWLDLVALGTIAMIARTWREMDRLEVKTVGT